jgi:hypothetical protein
MTRIHFVRLGRGTRLAIAALVLWVLTVCAGTTLFMAGNAAKRRAAAAAPGDPAPASAMSAAAAPTAATREPSTGMQAAGPGQPRPSSRVPPAVSRVPPPIPRVKVHSPPGEHPLLEFAHPALGAVGLACWFLFLGLHYRPLAWTSFGILMVTVAAGLGWLASNALAARHHGDGARAAVPRRLIVLHGAAATVTVALALLTALSASHG